MCDRRYQVDYYKKKQLGLIKDEDENPTIELYDTAPGFAPTIHIVTQRGVDRSRGSQLRCAVLSLNPRACALEQTSFNIYGNYKISYTKSI